MEEIAGFEDRLAGFKQRGDLLVQGCSDRVQSKLRQQVQAHQQGIRDSYSAICSTAQRVSGEAVERERGTGEQEGKWMGDDWQKSLMKDVYFGFEENFVSNTGLLM